MKKMTFTKAASLLLCFVMLLSAMPLHTTAVEAGEPVSTTTQDVVTYIDANGKQQTCDTYTVIDADYFAEDARHTLTSGWYYTAGIAVAAVKRLTVSGDVHLILGDGAELAAYNGICVEGDNSFSVYTVSDPAITGALTAYGSSNTKNDASIGSSAATAVKCGNISINGGNIEISGVVGIGKGDGSAADCGSITVSGGDIKINASKYGFSGNVTVNGGDIEVYGAENAFYAAESETVYINDGTVFAYASEGHFAFSKQPVLKAVGFGEAAWAVTYKDAQSSEFVTADHEASATYTAHRYVYIEKEADYYEYNATEGKLVGKQFTELDRVTVVDKVEDLNEFENGYYLITKNLTFSNNQLLKINGHVRIILCDGVTLNLQCRPIIQQSSDLTIYGQKEGTGKLNISHLPSNSYELNIHGGDVSVNTGITATMINVYGGSLTATGNSGFIGNLSPGLTNEEAEQYTRGKAGISSQVRIYGGTVKATGGVSGEYSGIGTRGGCGIDGDVTVYGGTLIANGGTGGTSNKGGNGGHGINGTLTVYGGNVTANGGKGGDAHTDNTEATVTPGSSGAGINGNINISGGSVTANAGEVGSATKGSDTVEFDKTQFGTSGILLPSGCSPAVTGGSLSTSGYYNCGIAYQGNSSDEQPLKVSDGYVSVNGGDGAVGTAMDIEITGGSVSVVGGNGISDGDNGSDAMTGKLTVSAGAFNATGGDGANGGNGISGEAVITNGEINIAGGNAVETATNSAASGGYAFSGDNVRIIGGRVSARGGYTAKKDGSIVYKTAYKNAPTVSGRPQCFVGIQKTKVDYVLEINFDTETHILMSYGDLVQYMYYDEAEKKFKYATGYAEKLSNDSYYVLNGWYYVDGDVTIDQLIDISGDVHIILKDGAHLNAKKGIDARPDYQNFEPRSLHIYAQSQATVQSTNGAYTVKAGCNTGRLTAVGMENNYSAYPGIGGPNSSNNCPITIHGGIIYAQGNDQGAPGIGGTSSTNNITINGGFVTAKGGGNASGIGGGNITTNITINGGTVIAAGNEDQYGGGAGIGGAGSVGNITVNSGTVIATGAKNAAGIGGANTGHLENAGVDYTGIVINGGQIIATGGENAPGIGNGGNAIPNLTSSVEGKITVKGGTVTSIGGKGHVGMELNSPVINPLYNSTATIKLDIQSTAVSVTVVGGENANAFDKCPFDDARALGYTVRVGDDPTNMALYTETSYKTRNEETFTKSRFVHILPCKNHKKGYEFEYNDIGYPDVAVHADVCAYCGHRYGTHSAHNYDTETGMCDCGGIGEYTYLKYDETQNKMVKAKHVAVLFDPKVGAARYTQDGSEIWYAVVGEVDFTDENGAYASLVIANSMAYHLNLILTENCHLTVKNIPVKNDQSLSIHAQSEPEVDFDLKVDSMSTTGRLTTIPGYMTVEYCAAGIGEYFTGTSESDYHPAGNININGGIIYTRGTSTAGIYTVGIGGRGNVCGNVTVRGGHTTVSSAGNQPAIQTNTFTMTGGYLLTTGSGTGAGIKTLDVANSVTVSGGTLIALGGENGHGIDGGSSNDSNGVVISGGTVLATGSGEGGHGIYCGNMTISGGMVTANATGTGYGIAFSEQSGVLKTLYINGGSVRVTRSGTHDTNHPAALYGIDIVRLYDDSRYWKYIVSDNCWIGPDAGSATDYKKTEDTLFHRDHKGFWVCPNDPSTITGNAAVSVEVAWTNMSFKYENGSWKPATEGGGVITVKNGEDSPLIKFGVTFNKSTDPSVSGKILDVNGSFVQGEVKVESGRTQTNSLQLTGKPNLALSNAHIGEIEIFITTFSLSNSNTPFSGEAQLGNDWYYFENGVIRKNFWLGEKYYGNDGKRSVGKTYVDGYTYYFDEETGNMFRGQTKWLANGLYFFDIYGRMLTYQGWHDVEFASENSFKIYPPGSGANVRRFYFNADGSVPVDTFITLDDPVYAGTYYISYQKGMLTGWQKLGENWYYFATRDREFAEDDYPLEKRYLNKGAMCHSGDFVISTNKHGQPYYTTCGFREDGSQIIDDMGTFTVMQNGKEVTHVYLYDKFGEKRKGFIDMVDEDGNDIGVRYYCDPDENGNLARTGFFERFGEKYYANDDYTLHRGWLDLDGERYYCTEQENLNQGHPLCSLWRNCVGYNHFDEEGRLIRNCWIDLYGRKAYRGDDGGIVKGWCMIDGKQYYFDDSGYMTTGWKVLNGNRYYFNSEGVQLFGWQKIGTYWYYLDTEKRGARLRGENVVDGYSYYFDEREDSYFAGTSGALVTGLTFGRTSETLIDKTYRYAISADEAEYKPGITSGDKSDPRISTYGTMLKNGTRVVDGNTYVFGADGHCDGPQ